MALVTEGEIAIVAAGIGAVAGIAGTVVTLTVQAWRDRKAWRRDQRLRAALQFLREVRRVDLMLSRHDRVGESGDELPDPRWRANVAMDLAEIEVFGSKDLAHAGRDVYQALQRLQDQGASVGAMFEMDQAEDRYRRILQDDLGLNETVLTSDDASPIETQPYHHEYAEQRDSRRSSSQDPCEMADPSHRFLEPAPIRELDEPRQPRQACMSTNRE